MDYFLFSLLLALTSHAVHSLLASGYRSQWSLHLFPTWLTSSQALPSHAVMSAAVCDKHMTSKQRSDRLFVCAGSVASHSLCKDSFVMLHFLPLLLLSVSLTLLLSFPVAQFQSLSHPDYNVVISLKRPSMQCERAEFSTQAVFTAVKLRYKSWKDETL